MPLYIKDDTTAALVAELARKRGVSKQDAVRLAVQAYAEFGKGRHPAALNMGNCFALHEGQPGQAVVQG